jgi:hypothetical protein
MSKRESTENDQQSSFKRPSLPESCDIDDAAGTWPLNITVETVETDGEIIDDDPLILYLAESTNESSPAQTESINILSFINLLNYNVVYCCQCTNR